MYSSVEISKDMFYTFIESYDMTIIMLTQERYVAI